MALGPSVGGRGGGRKGTKGLAWGSYFFAAVAGAAWAAVGLGRLLDWLLGVVEPPLNGLLGIVVQTGGGWLAPAVFGGAFLLMMGDLILDRIPNQIALWTAVVLASLAQTVDGRLADTVQQMSDQILASVGGQVTAWLGVVSAFGIAVVSTVAAYFMGRRVLAKGGV